MTGVGRNAKLIFQALAVLKIRYHNCTEVLKALKPPPSFAVRRFVAASRRASSATEMGKIRPAAALSDEERNEGLWTGIAEERIRPSYDLIDHHYLSGSAGREKEREWSYGK